MIRFKQLGALCALAALSAAVVLAQEQPADLTAEAAVIFRGGPGQALTPPSQAAPAAVVSDFLRSRGRSAALLDSLTAVSGGPGANGLTHLRFEQAVGGLRVYGSYVKASVNAQGELVSLIELLANPPAAGVTPATANERQALDAVLQQFYPGTQHITGETARSGNRVEFAHDGFFHRNPTVEKVAISMTNGALRGGYLVETWSNQGNLLHHTLVAGNGRVLASELRTNSDSYNIFPDHPGDSSQTVTDGPGAGNTQSPSGWLFASGQTTVNISGNNVHAYLDVDNNNAPDAGGTAVTGGNFLTSADLGQQPSTAQNRNVAVQNLFYLNNVIHDRLYTHGFTELAGNFQEDNFGNGGLGSDSVNAEAQDGGGTNNANFATPSDGSNPRMQMYIWTQSSPNRDGDLDSDIPWHEYGHGLTWRMIGNMSGPMSGAIGEGMSDVLAILVNDDDTVGEYSYNDPDGIRSAPYTNYPRTYGDFSGSSVHFDGEIYAATIWRLWELAQANTTSPETLFDDLIGGMNFTPAGPAMEQMRDGILAQAASERDCMIWEAFADFGIGVGAKAQIKGGGPFGGGNVTITESFAVPSSCNTSCVPSPEVCTDGIDNDCDELIDSADTDDCGGGSCTLKPVGDSCVANAECCSNNCKGKPGARVCK